MKKKLKTLVLSKETIRTFGAPGLAGVNGGDTTFTATYSCFTVCCPSRIQECISPPTGG
jgi:hypothetical protein